MKRTLVTLFSVLLVCTGLVALTTTSTQAMGQETCPASDGWEKFDGLDGHSFTYPGVVPEGATVENCVKYSTTVVFGTGVTVTSDGTHEISHASFRVIPGEPPPPVECPDGDLNGDAPGCGEAPPECPDGDLNGDAPGCGEAPPECPDGDLNGDEPGCGEGPPECPNGDLNGDEPGCGEGPPECPDGDLNGDEPGCGEPPPPPAEEVTVCHARGDGTYETLTIPEEDLEEHLAHGDLATVPEGGCEGDAPPPDDDGVGGVSDGGEDGAGGDVGGVRVETEVEHRFRCGRAIRIERRYEEGRLVDVNRTVSPTGERCSPAELRIPADEWERSHVEETGL